MELWAGSRRSGGPEFKSGNPVTHAKDLRLDSEEMECGDRVPSGMSD